MDATKSNRTTYIHSACRTTNQFILILCRKLEYAFQYDATKIAVTNMKDLDGVKNAINVILPEESKIFQCISATIKNEWIEKFEKALKFNQMKRKQNSKVSKNVVSRSNKQISTDSKVSKSTTKNSLASVKISPSESTMSECETANISYAPEWLLRVHEEIHTLIAQRHFDDALGLITKCEEYFTNDSSFQNANEIIKKVILLKRVSSIKILYFASSVK